MNACFLEGPTLFLKAVMPGKNPVVPYPYGMTGEGPRAEVRDASAPAFPAEPLWRSMDRTSPHLMSFFP